MKKLIFFFLGAFFYFPLSSQVWEDNLCKTNSSPTIQDKIDAFEKHKKTHPYTKGNGYKPYARGIEFIAERVSSYSTFNPNSLYIEWLKKEKNLKKNSASNWISKGPINTPIILSNGKKRGNGRINCIAFDPFDANIIW